MNSSLAFITGMIWLAVTFTLSAQGVHNLAVVACFFFSLFWLLPVTLLQLPDDFFLAAPFKRGRGGDS